MSYIGTPAVDVSGRQPRPARLTDGERKFLRTMASKKMDASNAHDQYLLGRLDGLAMCTYADTEDRAFLKAALDKQRGDGS